LKIKKKVVALQKLVGTIVMYLDALATTLVMVAWTLKCEELKNLLDVTAKLQ